MRIIHEGGQFEVNGPIQEDKMIYKGKAVPTIQFYAPQANLFAEGDHHSLFVHDDPNHPEPWHFEGVIVHATNHGRDMQSVTVRRCKYEDR